MSTSRDSREAWVEAVADAWRRAGHRFTPVRRILCTVIAATEEAWEVETLLERARKEDRGISITTVYRTVGLLVETGFLVEQTGPDRRQQYFRQPGPGAGTSVLACQDCGKVFPYEHPCLVLREQPSVHARGFIPERYSLRVDVRCPRVQQSDGCPEQQD